MKCSSFFAVIDDTPSEECHYWQVFASDGAACIPSSHLRVSRQVLFDTIGEQRTFGVSRAVHESFVNWMYPFVKSPQGIRDLRHRVLVFLSAMFWQPIPACDFSRQKAVVFSSEGWPYLHVNLSTIDTRTSKYLL